MKAYMLGVWSEYFPKSPFSINEPFDYESSIDSIEPFLNYLKSAELIIEGEEYVNCIFCSKKIDHPKVYSDGKFFWTSHYIHHIEHHDLIFDAYFRYHIIKNKYVPSTSEDFEYPQASFINIKNQLKEHLLR